MSIATRLDSDTQQLPATLDEIFREHYEFVCRTACRLTGNMFDAEDVIQTLFLRLFRSESIADVELNPKAYLYRATVNIALDVIRSRRRHIPTDDERQMLTIPTSDLKSRGEEELHDQLRAAIATLTPKAAQILTLRYVHGYSDAEIASLLGTSRGTVAVNLFRSRARLRRCMRNFREKDNDR